MVLKVHPRFVYFHLVPPGAAVFLNFIHFCNEAAQNPGELAFGDWITSCDYVVGTLVDTLVEVL